MTLIVPLVLEPNFLRLLSALRLLRLLRTKLLLLRPMRRFRSLGRRWLLRTMTLLPLLLRRTRRRHPLLLGLLRDALLRVLLGR